MIYKQSYYNNSQTQGNKFIDCVSVILINETCYADKYKPKFCDHESVVG